MKAPATPPPRLPTPRRAHAAGDSPRRQPQTPSCVGACALAWRRSRGDLETIPAPDAGVVDPPSDAGASSDAATALTDAGFLRDTSERNDAGESADDGGLTDAGELPPMPMPEDAGDAEDGDTGVVPPMPPPRRRGLAARYRRLTTRHGHLLA